MYLKKEAEGKEEEEEIYGALCENRELTKQDCIRLCRGNLFDSGTLIFMLLSERQICAKK